MIDKIVKMCYSSPLSCVHISLKFKEFWDQNKDNYASESFLSSKRFPRGCIATARRRTATLNIQNSAGRGEGRDKCFQLNRSTTRFDCHLRGVQSARVYCTARRSVRISIGLSWNGRRLRRRSRSKRSSRTGHSVVHSR